MLIHTWNAHSDIQAKKLNANHLHAHHSTNAQYTKYMHLGTRSYWGTKVRVLEVMHDRTTSTMQQGISTNHKSLQMHENNLKSLQKQHGYKNKVF